MHSVVHRIATLVENGNYTHTFAVVPYIEVCIIVSVVPYVRVCMYISF